MVSHSQSWLHQETEIFLEKGNGACNSEGQKEEEPDQLSAALQWDVPSQIGTPVLLTNLLLVFMERKAPHTQTLLQVK